MKLTFWTTIAILATVALNGGAQAQGHDWQRAASDDADALVTQDIQDGESRVSIGLMMAIGSFALRHPDFTSTEAAEYSAAFVALYMDELKRQGEPLAGPLPDQEPGTYRVAGTADEVKKRLKLVHPDSFAIAGASPVQLVKVKPDNEWYWIVKYQVQLTNENDERRAYDVYLYFKDGKLSDVRRDESSAKFVGSGALPETRPPAEMEPFREKILDGLKIEHLVSHRAYGFLIVRGDLANRAIVPVKGVEVEIAFTDAAGGVIYQLSAGVADGAYLPVGKSGAFSTSILDEHHKIFSYKANVLPSFQTAPVQGVGPTKPEVQ
jgi:hypothetical protein